MWRRDCPINVRRLRSPRPVETPYDPESLGAETRQACDLEGVGAGVRQFSKFKDNNSDINHTSLHFTTVKALIKAIILL